MVVVAPRALARRDRHERRLLRLLLRRRLALVHARLALLHRVHVFLEHRVPVHGGETRRALPRRGRRLELVHPVLRDAAERFLLLPLSVVDTPVLRQLEHRGGFLEDVRVRALPRLERARRGARGGRRRGGRRCGARGARARARARPLVARRAVDDCVDLGVGDVAVLGIDVATRGENPVHSEGEHLHDLLRPERLHLVGGRRAVAVDHLVEEELLLRALNDAHLHGAPRNEAVDVHNLRLADPVDARHCLHVHLRVPVRIEQDHGVRRLEVDPHPSGARRHDERKVGRVELVELLDCRREEEGSERREEEGSERNEHEKQQRTEMNRNEQRT